MGVDRLVVEDNVIRFVGGVVDPSFDALGITVNGAKGLLIVENVIDLANPAPVRHERCGAVYYFNNETSDGKLVHGAENSGEDRFTELQDLIEDSFVL
jgi:hypothetical protein